VKGATTTASLHITRDCDAFCIIASARAGAVNHATTVVDSDWVPDSGLCQSTCAMTVAVSEHSKISYFL
jgi:hypothetical protein